MTVTPWYYPADRVRGKDTGRLGTIVQSHANGVSLVRWDDGTKQLVGRNNLQLSDAQQE